MMNYVIIGKSGSGKSKIVDVLTENFKFSKIVTNTTRPIREGEKQGVDYNFISKEEFDRMLENDELAEYFIAGNGWCYGTSKSDLEGDDKLIILTPSGLRQLQEKDIKFKSIYVVASDKKRYIRQIMRGDDIKEIARRSETDKVDFDGIEDEVDYIVYNDTSIEDTIFGILSLMTYDE